MKERLNKMTVTRWFFLCLRAAAACLCAVFLMAQSGGIATKDPKAKEAMDAALKALGGADKIGGVKSLVIKGNGTTEGFSINLMGGGSAKPTSTGTSAFEFEIRILLPDNFIRIDRFSDRTTYSGVSQGKLLASNPPVIMMDSSGGGNMQQDAERAEAMAKIQASTHMDELSRFLIGTLAKAGPAPLTLSSGSTPGVFTLAKTDGAADEIEFDSKTGYPSVIKIGGSGGNTTATKSDTAKPGTSITVGQMSITVGRMSNNNEMRFMDRFSVSGIMFPRIIKTTGTMTNRELRIESVQVNPNLSLKDFEVPKQ